MKTALKLVGISWKITIFLISMTLSLPPTGELYIYVFFLFWLMASLMWLHSIISDLKEKELKQMKEWLNKGKK